MRKIALFCIMFASWSCSPICARAQQNAPKVRFGHIDAKNATMAQLLAFPRIEVLDPTCIVTGFSFSIVPKSGELTGPLKTIGGKLTDDEINLIKKYNAANTRIFIEDIHIKCGDHESVANNVVVNIIKPVYKL